MLDERITYIEEQLKRTAHAMDWIIESMIERGQGAKSGPPKLADVDKLKEEGGSNLFISWYTEQTIGLQSIHLPLRGHKK